MKVGSNRNHHRSVTMRTLVILGVFTVAVSLLLRITVTHGVPTVGVVVLRVVGEANSLQEVTHGVPTVGVALVVVGETNLLREVE